VLAGYLAAARAILAAHPDLSGACSSRGLPGHLERLRWFELPDTCVAPT
jgi:hypothetical protein